MTICLLVHVLFLKAVSFITCSDKSGGGEGQSHDISNSIYVKLRKVSAANIVGEVEPAPSMLRACVFDECTLCALEYYNVAKTEV